MAPSSFVGIGSGMFFLNGSSVAQEWSQNRVIWTLQVATTEPRLTHLALSIIALQTFDIFVEGWNIPISQLLQYLWRCTPDHRALGSDMTRQPNLVWKAQLDFYVDRITWWVNDGGCV